MAGSACRNRVSVPNSPRQACLSGRQALADNYKLIFEMASRKTEMISFLKKDPVRSASLFCWLSQKPEGTWAKIYPRYPHYS